MSVSVWYRSVRLPVTTARLCAEHGQKWIDLYSDGHDFEIRVDQGTQLALF